MWMKLITYPLLTMSARSVEVVGPGRIRLVVVSGSGMSWRQITARLNLGVGPVRRVWLKGTAGR